MLYNEEEHIENGNRLLRILAISNLSIRTFRTVDGSGHINFEVSTIGGYTIRVAWDPDMLQDAWTVIIDGLEAAYIVLRKDHVDAGRLDLSEQITEAWMAVSTAAGNLGEIIFNELGDTDNG